VQKTDKQVTFQQGSDNRLIRRQLLLLEVPFASQTYALFTHEDIEWLQLYSQEHERPALFIEPAVGNPATTSIAPTVF
jgi:hypothetical protein